MSSGRGKEVGTLGATLALLTVLVGLWRTRRESRQTP